MKEQRKEALKIVDKQQEIRQKVLADIGEAAKKLIDCSEEKENMDKAAVEALHQAEAGLRSLSIVMRQAANFWKHMEVSVNYSNDANYVHLVYHTNRNTAHNWLNQELQESLKQLERKLLMKNVPNFSLQDLSSVEQWNFTLGKLPY